MSYTTTDGRVKSPSYDTPAYRADVQAWFETLHLPWRWVPVTVACLAQTLATICARGQAASVLVCNLCDGDEIHGYPGLSVVRALERAGIPFTGATSACYALTTSKVPMQERVGQCGIATPPFACLGNSPDDMARLTTQVGYPAIIKPEVSATSLGISLHSCVHDAASASAQFSRLVQGEQGVRFLASGIFAERFVDGPEFTMLVVADQMEARTGVLYVLEVNANCGLASDEETSVGQILRLARVPIHQLIASILEDALVWFQSTGQPQGHGQ